MVFLLVLIKPNSKTMYYTLQMDHGKTLNKQHRRDNSVQELIQ